ncbi:MAG: efflux RND transporter permease subunit, partial [Plesiomonas sp.]
QIHQQLQNAITLAPTATLDVANERLALGPMNNITEINALNELLISDGQNRTFRLGDIGHVSLGYQEPSSAQLYFDGQPAIGLGVSNISGGNIVEMGRNVSARLADLQSRIPVGMSLQVLSPQGETVNASISDFVDNLIAAVAIVVVTLLIFMGMRSGLLIGFVLLLTVAATLIIMQIDGIDMQRISLGALIIALGMLVDNAIVVTEGILIRTQKGEDPKEAALAIVKQTIWPLLGGTVVGIMAFSAIGLSPDNTGEYAGSLFWVIMYSMLLSWLLAVTLTPLFCVQLFRAAKTNQEVAVGKFLRGYQSVLAACIRLRWPTLIACVVMLVLAIIGMKFVPPGFFPASTRAQFVVDYWLPQGTRIERTNQEVREIDAFVRSLPEVKSTTTLVGSGGLRFMLVYGAEEPNSSYAQLLVDVEDWKVIDSLMPKIRAHIEQHYPDAMPKVWKFQLGPGGGSKIEAKFSGPDTKILRQLAEQARQIYLDDGGMTAIKDDWRQPVKVVQPIWDEAKARQ